MSDTATLKTLLDTARRNLTEAQTVAKETKRPHNVCEGHDAFFGLVQAIANGVETSLLIQADKMTDPFVLPNGMGKQPPGDFWAQVWILAREKASLIIVCVTAVIIAAIAFDRIEKVMTAVKEIRSDHADTTLYEPAPW